MYLHISLGVAAALHWRLSLLALAHLTPASQLSCLVLTGGDARRRRFVFVIITARSSCSKVSN